MALCKPPAGFRVWRAGKVQPKHRGLRGEIGKRQAGRSCDLFGTHRGFQSRTELQCKIPKPRNVLRPLVLLTTCYGRPTAERRFHSSDLLSAISVGTAPGGIELIRGCSVESLSETLSSGVCRCISASLQPVQDISIEKVLKNARSGGDSPKTFQSRQDCSTFDTRTLIDRNDRLAEAFLSLSSPCNLCWVNVLSKRRCANVGMRLLAIRRILAR